MQSIGMCRETPQLPFDLFVGAGRKTAQSLSYNCEKRANALIAFIMLAIPRIAIKRLKLNACVGLTYGIDLLSFLAQFVFMLFVLGTVRRAWNGAESVTAPAS